MADIEKNREYQVAKHNDLVQKSRYSLSVQQQKVLLYLISKVKPLDDENTRYSITIKDYCEICGIDYKSGSNYISIKQSLEGIDAFKTWIVQDKKHIRFRWFDILQIDENSGTIEVTFHDTVKPYLFDLQERYTQYKLINVLPMRSKYSIRLYEILSSYKRMRIKKFSIEELKELLDATEYTHFSHFMDRVIKTALNEIDRYTNLDIDYRLEKEGKKYTTITFFIRENNQLREIVNKYTTRAALAPKHKKDDGE